MKPIKFDGVNVVFGANQPEYQPLPAERVGKPKTGQINTCWELSQDELKQIQETGKIWLSVLTFGQPLQPVLVSIDKPEPLDPSGRENC
jgi:hypothetical protein